MAATHRVVIYPGVSNNTSWDTVSGFFWFDITSGALAQLNGSAWPNATAADNQAIQNGAVKEESFSFQFPAGLAKANPAAVEAFIDRAWQNRNSELNGTGSGLYQNITESPTGIWG